MVVDRLILSLCLVVPGVGSYWCADECQVPCMLTLLSPCLVCAMGTRQVSCLVSMCYQVCCQEVYYRMCTELHPGQSRSKACNLQAGMVLPFRKPTQWKPFSQSWRPSKLKCSRLVFLSVKSARQLSMRLCSALNASSTEPCGSPTSAHFLRMSLAKGRFLYPKASKGKSWEMPQGSSLTRFQSIAHGCEKTAIGKCETIGESVSLVLVEYQLGSHFQGSEYAMQHVIS